MKKHIRTVFVITLLALSGPALSAATSYELYNASWIVATVSTVPLVIGGVLLIARVFNSNISSDTYSISFGIAAGGGVASLALLITAFVFEIMERAALISDAVLPQSTGVPVGRAAARPDRRREQAVEVAFLGSQLLIRY